ncbi:MAG: zinc-ribbon domain-containing protein [Polyangiaceae bacterium]|jgi:predicted Zn finger-like uncharacterized protein
MKITCKSCQSKYNVADEKVQGKIVKIRCRKCGSTIVVDGAGQAAANGSVAAVPSGGSRPSGEGKREAAEPRPWHVNVAENDQRTMSLEELVDAYNSAVVTQDTFIWTDGMDDWKALAEVDAVVSALQIPEPPVQAPPPSSAVPNNGFAHDPHAAYAAAPAQAGAAEEDDGHDATRVYDSRAAADASEPSTTAPETTTARTEPKRAAVVKRETRARDLFASKISPDELRGFPETAVAASQGPTIAMLDDGSGKRPGERNENSVLFSLAVLTKTAEHRATADRAEAAADDDSGLIDLKALAAKTESMRPPVGMADAALFSPPLGAMPPLGVPASTVASPLGDRPKSRLPLVVGGGALVALLLGAGIAIGTKIAGGGSVAAASPTGSAITAPTGTASAPAESGTAAAGASPSASAASSASASPKPKAYPGGGGAMIHAAAPSRPAGVSPAAGDTATVAAPAPAQPPAKKAGSDCGCNGDLMCLMKCSTH